MDGASLTFTTLCANSADYKLVTFFLEVFWDSLYGSGSVFWHAVGKLSKFRMRIIELATPPICILSALCQVWFHFGPKYFHVAGQMLH